MKAVPYLHQQLKLRDLTLEDVETALANEVDRELQEDGRTRIWGWVERVEYFVRVIILEDGETVLNAFRDRNFTKQKGRR